MLEAWGEAGLRAHVTSMQAAYAHRASVLTAAAEKHLSGLASWRAPQVDGFASLPSQPQRCGADLPLCHHKLPQACCTCMCQAGI